MSRSLKKGPYIDEKLLRKVLALRKDDRKIIKTWARFSAISPEMVGFIFGVHNGKDFTTVSVTEDMVGHKLGEFAPTTKFIRHGGKMQKAIEAGAEASQAAKSAAEQKSPASKK